MAAAELDAQMVASQKAVVIQSAVRGWLARTKYLRVRRAVVYLQCCYRRMRARRELRQLRIEAKSVEHYKQLNKGMEIKVMQLQCKVDEQARENRSHSEQLSALRASPSEEVERLREDKAQEKRIRELQEQLQRVESEKSCSEGQLGQEMEELKQRLTELEAMTSNLKEEKDALNQRIMEQSQELEDQLRWRVAAESQELLCQLEGERARYQNLVKECARLEQCCENLQDEVAFQKQTPSLQRSPSSDSILDSECSYPSSLWTAPSRDDADPQSENIAEILGLNRSPEKMVEEDSVVEEDFKYAYDAARVSNKLLESQLQEQQQELEGLRLDNCSLKQLSKQQQSLIQDLQLQQEEGRLQHQLVQLKRENLDLKGQLERQEKNMLKLQKQLQTNMKQIQDLTASGEARLLEQTVEEMERPFDVPCPAGAFGGMLGCKAEDEGRLIRTIITDFKPQHSPGALPTLPAYVLFMCFRYADSGHDEHRISSLFAAAVSGIKRVVKKHSEDFGVVALWLANTCCLINCLRQYGGDQSYRLANTPKQNQHCLGNLDLASHCQSLGDLAIQLYQQLICMAQKKLKPMIVTAMLEGETILGLSWARSTSYRKQPAAPAYTLDSLLQQLSSFHEALGRHQLEPMVVGQAFRQLLFTISSVALNYLLLSSAACSWRQGVQLSCNVSQLEEWLRAKGLQQSGAREVLQPLSQAAQLLQVKKTTQEDAEAICCLCTALTTPQIMKILRAYTPAARLEEHVSPSFISSVENRLAERAPAGPCQLLVDTAHLFPMHLPFSCSPVQLDELCIPDSINLSFLTRV
ncbi:unconventional myosin-Va-like isoform X2 [Mauremys reevesii]|uniref:unconventional myosin-Va-like isoform X2 n=1 Tax=Mauremys reevesii TaxID=260615 RepID=UPI00193F8FBF|nr:unconventional myosin-Va-like isoform X2 [Mauremys reevesii]